MEDIRLVASSEVEYAQCEDVKPEEVQKILDIYVPQMKGILKAENGYGLAAPQVGIKKKFFIAWNQAKQDYIPYFNAFYITNGSSRVKMTEGCLSYPRGNSTTVKRFKSIKLIHEIWNGEKFTKKSDTMKGPEAIAMQHECDHLRGITIHIK